MIKIVTDSIADLPREYIEKYAITVLPLNINIGNNTFLDGSISALPRYVIICKKGNPENISGPAYKVLQCF